MDQLQIFSFSRCSTCRRALAWLDQRDLAYVLHDIVETPPSRDQLNSALVALGDRKRLFNTSGQSYRALGAAVVKAFSDDQALDALASDGKLIKRPLVVLPNGTWLAGFKQEVWEETFQR